MRHRSATVWNFYKQARWELDSLDSTDPFVFWKFLQIMFAVVFYTALGAALLFIICASAWYAVSHRSIFSAAACLWVIFAFADWLRP